MARTPSQKRQLTRVRRMFERHATALGLACIAWSTLESVVDEFLGLLIPLEPGNTERIVTSNIDFRAKLEMLVHLGFMEKYKDLWFLELQTLINKIDNELRPERNRYVHDTWRLDLQKAEPVITRSTKDAKLRKPQAFQLELVTETETPINFPELKTLSARVSAATWELHELHMEHARADP